MVSAASAEHAFETPSGDARNDGILPMKTGAPEVRLVARAELDDSLEPFTKLGFLPVLVPAPKPSERGHLALLVEEAIELALERRGSLPPGLSTEADLEASLRDQLYRARLIEFRGLAIALGPLAALGGTSGILDLEDSAALRFWCDAPKNHPVRLVVDDENATLGMYGPPRPLGELLPTAGATVGVEPEALSPEAPARDARKSPQGDDDGPVPAGNLARALMLALADPAAPSASAPPSDASNDGAVVEPADAAPVTTDSERPLFAEEAPETSQIRPAALGPLHERAAESWPTWLRDLEGARGPKPLASVERMFVKSYVPLRDAHLRRIAPPEVAGVLEGWASSFAKSYTETWSALRVRTKRPTMVLDVPDVALRIGRLHGARSVQLLLVDGLRFDLGLRVEALLRARLGHEAALTERLLLWSALPSNTATQLELLGRGPDALRGLERAGDSEVTVARGRMARVPRRVKAGHRELLKLDLVEAELGEPGGTEPERLDALAGPLTDAIAELCEKLPTRTLLVVFGDHGFVLDRLADGSTVARQGGSRPEEVLVPAFAWLVGGVQ